MNASFVGRLWRTTRRAAYVGSLAVAVGVLCVPAPANAVGSGPWMLKDLGHHRVVVAGFTATRNQTSQRLSNVIRVWGRPVRARVSRGACVADWKRPRVRVFLRTYGGLVPGTTVCDPRNPYVSEIRTLGPNWQAGSGLWVGDDESLVQRAYPDAITDTWSAVGDVWLLSPVEEYCGLCGGSDTTTISSDIIAIRRGGLVAGFYVAVGAEGE